MKILLIGDEERSEAMRLRLSQNPQIEADFSDGDEEEDYKEYDAIMDLNFDDDPQNLPIYAALRDRPVFVSAVKLQLAEAVYVAGVKVKCQLFGINAIPEFIANPVWEISLFHRFLTDDLKKLMATIGIHFLSVEDRVGFVKPRVIFMIINEACFTLQEGTASIQDIDEAMKLGTNYPYGPFEWCDKIGITVVFETLMSLYEDTKDERYKVCPLLKTKYLKNETFYKVKNLSQSI